MRRGFGELVAYVQAVSRVDDQRLMRFFARGMLVNVIAAMNLLDASEPWAKKLIEACREGES